MRIVLSLVTFLSALGVQAQLNTLSMEEGRAHPARAWMLWLGCRAIGRERLWAGQLKNYGRPHWEGP